MGLAVTPSPARAPYIAALRAYYLAKDYSSGLPYAELVPMQAYPSANLHPRQLRSLWTSHDWVAQRKLNGCRLILHFVRDVGIFAHARNINQRTYRRRELTNHLLFRDFKPSFSAAIDSEGLIEKPVDTRAYTKPGEVTRSSLHSTAAVLRLRAEASRNLQVEQDAAIKIHSFDVVSWQGTDLRKRKLAERLGYLDEFRKVISTTDLAQHFEFPPIVTLDKKAFYDQVIMERGEGIMLKNLSSRYEDSTSRNPNAWIKVKKSIELIAYVSGYEPASVKSRWSQMVGCLLLSVVTTEGPRLVAKLSNFEYRFRKEISFYDRDTGRVSMSSNIYGKVVLVTGQEFSQRAFRLVHPAIVHWRSDLRQEDCSYSTSDLENLRLGVGGNPLRKIEVK
jgi:ATP-dependent DNA ligase